MASRSVAAGRFGPTGERVRVRRPREDRVFRHLGRPGRPAGGPPDQGSLALSLLVHALGIALLVSIPAAPPEVEPDRTAALVSFLEVSSQLPVQPYDDRVSVSGDGAATAQDPNSLEAPVDTPSELPDLSGEPVGSDIPRPQLSLMPPPIASHDQLPAQPDDVLLEPVFAADEILSSGATPKVLNSRAFARRLAARYPARQDWLGISGEVLVRFVVGVDGLIEPESVMVLSYQGEAFVLPTVRHLPMLRFRPAELDGKAVRVRVELPVRWTPPPF